MAVYLLHFDRPYKHAKHYTGYSKHPKIRIDLHRRGIGANLMNVIFEAGIGFQVAKIWYRGGTRKMERRLKNSGGASRYCPICKKAKQGPS